MPSPVRLLLMVAPLAGYFYLLALWQAGRHPRVIAGALDVTLLAMGLGGLVIFGPFGDLLARSGDGGGPALGRWLILILTWGLIVSALARRSASRLVIYHVDAENLDLALPEALGRDEFLRTMDGYEDRSHTRGIRVELSKRWQSAVIEAYGRDPDALIREFAPGLRERLRTESARPTRVAMLLFGVSALIMLVPLTGHYLAQPHNRAALRVFLQHLKGG